MATPSVAGLADSEHRAIRPIWTCAADGQPWPCAATRKLLADAVTDRDALARHLAALQAVAADDLGVAGPSSLYRRFVAWTLGCDEVCRVCGRGGHTAIAGIPRRLVPCDGLPTVIPPLRTPDR